MMLLNIELQHFRNYDNCIAEFGHQRNVLMGLNAQGKTNILEAIYILCLARSFRTNSDREFVAFAEKQMIIRGEFVADNGIKHQVVVEFSAKNGKQISVDRKRVHRFSEYIGQFPVVITSPEEYRLTTGPPSERRRFFDILLSQLSGKYLHQLQEFNRVLKQRNTILNEPAHRSNQVIEPWNEALVEKGGRIIWERYTFVDQFRQQVQEIFSGFPHFSEQFSIEYYPENYFSGLDDVRTFLSAKLDSVHHAEYQQRVTLVGPHRDEFKLMINGRELRKFGSRGQHKTVLVAFMLAEFYLMKAKLGQTPIILMDDIFSEIDQDRESSILDHIDQLGQTFLTTTDIEPEQRSTTTNNDRLFYINQGTIRGVI